MIYASPYFRAGLRIVGGSWLLVSVIFLGHGCLRVISGLKSREWPQVEGRVIESHIRPIYASGTPKYYNIQVIYTYSVDGSVYQNDKITYKGFVDPEDTDYDHLQDAQHITNKYPVGCTVPVHYNPANKSISVLDPGLNSQTSVSCLLAICFLLISLLLLLFPLQIQIKFASIIAKHGEFLQKNPDYVRYGLIYYLIKRKAQR